MAENISVTLTDTDPQPDQALDQGGEEEHLGRQNRQLGRPAGG